MKILITHIDLDGIGVLVLEDFFNLNTHFDRTFAADYGFEEDPFYKDIFEKATEIVIVDLSLSESVYDELISKGKKVEIYDHHDTSSWLSTKPNCVHDLNRCGTKIFFEEFIVPKVKRFKPCVKKFVDLVDAYDRWVLNSPLRKESENLQRVWSCYASWSLPDHIARHSRFIQQMSKKLNLFSDFEWNITEKMYIEETLKKEENSYNQAVAMMKTKIDNHGKKFGIWKAWGRISITASRILRERPDYDYLVCLQDSPDNWGKISVRAIEGKFDVTTLASVGGHKAAGGTTLSSEDALALWNCDTCFKRIDEWEEESCPIEPILQGNY